MANVNRPQGAVPVGNLSGANWNHRITSYLIPASDGTKTHIGDFVKLAGSSGAAGTMVAGQDCEGMATVIKGTATDVTLVGAVVGFSVKPTDLNLSGLYRAASENRIAYVTDDPMTIYEMQEDSVGNNLDADMVGLSTDIITGTGSDTTGISGQMLDSSDTATALGQVRILGLSKRADNAIGTYGKWLVVINEHAYNTKTDI